MVDKEDVRKVAENARLEISDEEAGDFVEDFEQILDVFDQLGEIDTEDVEPAFHPVEVEPETRSDSQEECLDTEQIFANTGNEEEGKFKGPSA